MSPKVFIVIDNEGVTESVVVGDIQDIEVITLDFDSIELDPDEARRALADHADALDDPAAHAIRDRLSEIVHEDDLDEFDSEFDEEEYDECEHGAGDIEFDDFDDEDLYEKFNPPSSQPGHHANEQDYSANELIPDSDPSVLDPRD